MEKDKKIPVHISITGIHKAIIGESSGSFSLAEADETRETSTGYYSRRGESIFIIFDSSTSPIVSNRIKICGTDVEIRKSLSSPTATPISHIFYSLNELKSGIQETPYGRLDLGTFTKEITCSENETEFTCYLTGTMHINNSPVSEFELKIEAVIY